MDEIVSVSVVMKIHAQSKPVEIPKMIMKDLKDCYVENDVLYCTVYSNDNVYEFPLDLEIDPPDYPPALQLEDSYGNVHFEQEYLL